ncbi:trypsin-1-like [Panulirus ornatus]|uniref:trypsin-1-like n=1 Tax=Panulirus ornatus TaxID=150431 RepID=UPI003A894F5C
MRANMLLSAATLLVSVAQSDEFAFVRLLTYVFLTTNHIETSDSFAIFSETVPCGSQVTVSPGSPVQFQSNNYPSNYPPNENCQWSFQADDPEDTLTVVCSFNVRASRRCSADKLTFTEFETGGYATSVRYCGNHGTITYNSYGPQVIATFRSNRRGSAPGFSCTVSVDGEETTTEAPTTPDVGETPSPGCPCGNVNRATRIVGGQETEVNEYPWQIGLVTSSYNLICGGSIISKDWVLTAAHCVDGSNVAFVLIGDHDFTSGSDTSTARLAAVEQVISHPRYNSRTMDNDIALLKLRDSLEFSREVAPVCLPPDLDNQYVGVTATVTGWGATSEGSSLSPQLQEVDVPVLSNAVCSSSYSSITSNMVCAGFSEGGKDSCQGDSGGPMVYMDTNNYVQIGVVSFGRGCARPGYPGVYARVTEYMGWISSNTGGSGYTC